MWSGSKLATSSSSSATVGERAARTTVGLTCSHRHTSDASAATHRRLHRAKLLPTSSIVWRLAQNRPPSGKDAGGRNLCPEWVGLAAAGTIKMRPGTMVLTEVPTPRDSMDTRTRTTRGSHNVMTPVLVCMSAIIIVVAVAHDPDAEYSGVWRCCLVLLVVPLVACAGLALEGGGACVASEDAGPPRTYRMSSLLYCASLLGWQLLAVLHRTTSSADQLRGATALLRARSCSLLPPFAIVGAVYFVLGLGLGFQQLPLLRKLQVTCFEIALFTQALCVDNTPATEPPERLIGRGWPKLREA